METVVAQSIPPNPQFHDLSCPSCPPIDCGPIYQPTPDSMFSSAATTESYPPLESKRLSFRTDVLTLPGRFFEEIEALATCENALFLGTAGGIAAVLHNNVDSRVAQHQPRSGNWSDVITDFGDAFPVQLPLLGGMYVTSLCLQDDGLHELTLTMFTTYKFTLFTSVALQYATRTRSGNSGVFNLLSDSGFPSEQAATTFALAAVVDEAFGWKGGLPAYLFAGVIACAEVDQNRHTVSEVVFGAAMGYVIGKSIGALHYRPDAPCKLVPLVDTYSGTQGLGVEFVY
jgi:membrane-associated phospholipid phosphatase